MLRRAFSAIATTAAIITENPSCSLNQARSRGSTPAVAEVCAVIETSLGRQGCERTICRIHPRPRVVAKKRWLGLEIERVRDGETTRRVVPLLTVGQEVVVAVTNDRAQCLGVGIHAPTLRIVAKFPDGLIAPPGIIGRAIVTNGIAAHGSSSVTPTCHLTGSTQHIADEGIPP